MRALTLKNFGEMVVSELPMPTPLPDHAIVKILATGICGSDVHGYTGENGRRHPGQVMGHETVGTVHQTDATSGLRVGELVTINPVMVSDEDSIVWAGREQYAPSKRVLGVDPSIPAAFAEYVLVPVRNIVRLPELANPAFGALVEPLAVALHALERAGMAADQNILIAGGGPIGQSCIIAAISLGARSVLVSEPDAARRALCERLGATALDPADGELAVQITTRIGTLADLAVDAVGISATISSVLAAVAPGATVCLVGMGSPQVSISAYEVTTQERTITGSFTYSAAAFDRASALLRTVPTQFEHLISSEVTPERANEAFRSLADSRGPAGKVLVRFALDPAE